LQHLFNAYLKQGIYSRIYKKAKTIVFKKPGKKVGDYIKAKVYRPITLLNTVNKILKIIFVQRLSGLIKTYKLLPSAQIRVKKTVYAVGAEILNEINLYNIKTG